MLAAASVDEAMAIVDAAADGDAPIDLLLCVDDGTPGDTFGALAAQLAVVVVSADPDASLAWFDAGAEDVLDAAELASPQLWRRFDHAVARHRRGVARAMAYATDPATGLPHRRQFVEHLSQLLALRERDPSPMAVLALRVELPPSAGSDVHGVLRRKAAVRLRAAVRASDVVAAVDDTYCVLLPTLLDAADAAGVAGKLASALAAPYSVGAAEFGVTVASAIAIYPQDGNQAERLLRRALALAAVAPPSGGLARAADAGAAPGLGHDPQGMPRDAANDAG